MGPSGQGVGSIGEVPDHDPRLDNPTWLDLVHRKAKMSAAEIARALDEPVEVVEAALGRVGPRPPRRPPQLDDPEFMVRMLCDEHHTIEGLAELLGCSATAVRNAIRRPHIAEALEARRYDPSLAASAARVGRARINPGPSLDTLVELAAARRNVTIPELVKEFDLDSTQERRLGEDLAKLVADGTMVKTSASPALYWLSDRTLAERQRTEAGT